MKTFPIFTCRICKSNNYSEILNLGEMALTGVFLDDGGKVPKSKLGLNFCKDCSLVQLNNTHDKVEMFGDLYMYRSSVTNTMQNHFFEIIEISRKWLNNIDKINILEIASNDGTLVNMLNNYTKNITAIDPSAKKYKDNYPKDTKLYLDFFDQQFNEKFKPKNKFDLIISLAVFYDIDEPVEFAKTIESNLNHGGIWITEQTSSLTLLDTKAYDSICHEHLTYLSFDTINKICNKANLKIIDVYKNNINGNSFILVISKKDSSHKANDKNINNYLEYEKSFKPEKLESWQNFNNFVIEHKNKLKRIIKEENRKGQILGYGASTKGNVILQYLDINREDLNFILERDSNKFGLETPGTKIPIISEIEGKKHKPTALLAFPWHFKNEIVKREEEFLKDGGKIIFPLPDIEVVEQL